MMITTSPFSRYQVHLKLRDGPVYNRSDTSDTVYSTVEAPPDTASSTEEATPDSVSATEESPPEMSAAASGSPLNLCPKPVYPRTSEGSVDSEMETKEEKLFQFDILHFGSVH